VEAINTSISPNSTVMITRIIVVAAGITPQTHTAGGVTAAATENIGPGPTEIVP
jgi:hypothetical protein